MVVFGQLGVFVAVGFRLGCLRVWLPSLFVVIILDICVLMVNSVDLSCYRRCILVVFWC